jgi:diguanylate cyclase (GGDEF)-like protein/PAS domain S-box-containing protein
MTRLIAGGKTGKATAGLVVLIAVVAAVILAVDLSLPLGVAGGVPYVALVLMGLWLPSRRYILVLAGGATVLTIVGYFYSPAGGSTWVVLSNRGLALFAIWIVAALLLGSKWRDKKIRIMNAELKQRVEERTAELRQLNQALRDEITERTRAKEALQKSEERLRSISANLPGIVYRRVLKPDGTIHFPFVSDKAREMFGMDAQTIMADASVIRKYVHPDDYERLQEAIRHSAKTLETLEIELRIPQAEGQTRWVRNLSEPRRQNNGDVVWDGLVLDITAHKEAKGRIEYLAYYDQLTGLPNRDLFVDRVNQLIASTGRGEALVVVLALDLKRFKVINDTLGIAVGDAVLKAVGERLTVALRPGDTVARLAGDQFLIALSGISGMTHVVSPIHKIFEVFARPFSVGDHILHLGCCVGLSVYPKDAGDVGTLIKHADTALHKAKGEGSDGYVFFTADLDRQTVSLFALEKDLREAIERKKELVLYYQPLVDIETRKIVGLEALARWQRPDIGLIPPGDFIGVAEQTGLIVPLGEMLLRTACAQNRAWQEAGLPKIPVSVNISGRQIHKKDFAAIVKAILAETELDPRYLKLELTESSLLADVETTTTFMRELNEIGIRFAIDDFGTGYSSLSYLPRFPIEVLKIDRSFVTEMTTDQGSAALVNAITAIARSLNMEVIAEGVENDEQLIFLRAYQCNAIQGFLFSPPVPADEIPRLVERGFPGVNTKGGNG